MLHFFIRFFVITFIIGLIAGTIDYLYHKAKDKIEEDGILGLIIDTFSRLFSFGICVLFIRNLIKAILK